MIALKKMKYNYVFDNSNNDDHGGGSGGGGVDNDGMVSLLLLFLAQFQFHVSTVCSVTQCFYVASKAKKKLGENIALQQTIQTAERLVCQT